MSSAGEIANSTVWDKLPAGDRVRQLLQAAAASPADAYLLVGPDGTKSEAARVFAAAVLCPEQCGWCEACRRILAGLHPDVQIYEPEGYTFPVELIRQIVTSAAQTPMESDARVFILEEAHRILERSQNALLKGLEEPGHSVTWILLADTLEPLLPTILSRCQIIEFPPMADDAVIALLQSRLGLRPERAAKIARAAAGSLRRALKLATDPGAADVRRLALEAATRPAGSPREALAVSDEIGEIAARTQERLQEQHRAELADFDETIGKGRGASAARKRLADKHKRALRRAETDVYLDFLFWLGSAYRDLAAAGLGTPSHAMVFQDMGGDVEEDALFRPIAFCLEMIESSARAELAIRENANAPLAVESILLRGVQGAQVS